MAEPQVFEFILRDDGSPGAAPTPGAAAREKLAPAGSPDSRLTPQDAGGRQPGRTPRSDQAEPVLKPLLDAIQKATKYSTTAAMAAAGAGILGPLMDIGRLIDDLRSGRSPEKAKPGAAAAAGGSAGASPQPGQLQNLTIRQAVINAAGAKILISGGDVVVQGGRTPNGGGATAPRGPRPAPGGGSPQPQPSGRPQPEYGVPALRTPMTPARTYDIDQMRDRAYANMGRRASQVNLPSTTVNAGAMTAASQGVTQMGMTAMRVIPPLAALVVTAGAAALALRGLWRRSNEQAQALASYNSMLAAAQARSQLANLRQDVRSAESLGRELAGFTDAQNRLGNAATRIMNVVEKPFLQQIVPLLEGIATVVEKAGDLLESEVVQGIGDILGHLPILGPIGEALKMLGRNSEKANEQRAMAKGDFYSLFESYKDLDIDDKEFSHNVNADRIYQNVPGLGPLPLP